MALEVNELRIGSYVGSPIGNKRITSINLFESYYITIEGSTKLFHINELWSIRLSEDVLAGIHIHEYNDFSLKRRMQVHIHTELTSSNIFPRVKEYESIAYIKRLKSVHMLQNFYFAHTGEELSLKQLVK